MKGRGNPKGLDPVHPHPRPPPSKGEGCPYNCGLINNLTDIGKANFDFFLFISKNSGKGVHYNQYLTNDNPHSEGWCRE
jgi:hypothetical protein